MGERREVVRPAADHMLSWSYFFAGRQVTSRGERQCASISWTSSVFGSSSGCRAVRFRCSASNRVIVCTLRRPAPAVRQVCQLVGIALQIEQPHGASRQRPARGVAVLTRRLPVQ